MRGPLTGQLALPLGFHTAWNFVQVCVLGFSGGASVLGGSFIGLSDKGPGLWTGGASGPEGAINQPTPVPNVIGALSDPDVVWHQPGWRLFAGNDQTSNDQSS
jgi:hypothetical protein